MTSTFSGISIAGSALTATRQAVETAGHNVANANTAGYSRQEVVLAARTPLPAPYTRYREAVGQVGTGVDMVAVRRLRDAFVDTQLRLQMQALGQREFADGIYGRLEDIFLEPSDKGLGDMLNKFWNAWDELGNSPTSSGARGNLISQAQSLTQRFNQMYDQLNALKEETVRYASVLVEDVNSTAAQVAELNARIRTVQVSGDQANDLRDQRDLLLDKLARTVSFQATEDEFGSVPVYVGGGALVDGDRSFALATDGTQVTWANGGSRVSLRGGELRGVLDAVYDDPTDATKDGSIIRHMNDLNQLAGELATAVNGLHETGMGLDGVDRGLPLFEIADPSRTAGCITVNADLVAHPEWLAAATSALPGDGSNAQAIAALRGASLASLGGATLNGCYEGTIVRLGVAAQRASAARDNQQVVVDHLAQQREALSGVSLDEEAADMVRFQNSYAAAAHFMSVIDDMLDVLINTVGAAGR